jgi:OTU domain-containing protein 6
MVCLCINSNNSFLFLSILHLSQYAYIHVISLTIWFRAQKEWDVKFQAIQKKHGDELAALQSLTDTSSDNVDDQKGTGEETIVKEAAVSSEKVADNSQLQSQEPSAVVEPQLSAKEKALAKRLKKKKTALLKEKQREETIAYEIANAPNPRQIEIDAMKELYLNPHKLQIEEIAADGNCLYRAIARQLDYLNDDSAATDNDFEQMRKACADQLLKLREEYEPFADLSEYNVSSFEEYVDCVRGSSEWGGHLELRALSSALQKTIVIYSADGAPLHIKCNDDSDDKSKEEDTDTGIIRLSFHRRYYALGEHYNSVVPVASE